MKEYNRKTKRWENIERPATSLKKPETCKGKKSHDFVLLIPKYVSKDHNLSKDEVEEYYQIEADRHTFEIELDRRLKQIGVNTRRWTGYRSKFYKCAVCGKEKCEYEN
jgi:hypothetical protein